MGKFFIPPACEGIPLSFWFDPSAAAPLFGEHIPANFFKTVIQVEDPKDADILVLPNNFTFLHKAAHEYIAQYADVGEKYGKPVYVFSCGDHTDTLVFDSRVNVLRYSLYRTDRGPKDISMPTLVADMGPENVPLREKSEIPVVSFCGKADFGTPRETAAAWFKRAKLEIRAVFGKHVRARIRGVFWRKWAIDACNRSSLVKTFFIIRKRFSGALRTIELDPAQARREFVESIRQSDFVLAPKGDGNYSNRFLEALSAGRIPVLIDTDTVLPLENVIPYEKIIVRVPMGDVSETPRYIREFYDALSPEEWKVRQQLARDTFERYLRQDSFFTQIFVIR